MATPATSGDAPSLDDFLFEIADNHVESGNGPTGSSSSSSSSSSDAAIARWLDRKRVVIHEGDAGGSHVVPFLRGASSKHLGKPPDKVKVKPETDKRSSTRSSSRKRPAVPPSPGVQYSANCGAPVWSLDWCPVREPSGLRYLAVGTQSLTSSTVARYNSRGERVGERKVENNVIQIWAVPEGAGADEENGEGDEEEEGEQEVEVGEARTGDVAEGSSLEDATRPLDLGEASQRNPRKRGTLDRPRGARRPWPCFLLGHRGGTSWSVRWSPIYPESESSASSCPRRSSSNSHSSSSLGLGLLGAVLGDGTLQVFRIPRSELAEAPTESGGAAPSFSSSSSSSSSSVWDLPVHLLPPVFQTSLDEGLFYCLDWHPLKPGHILCGGSNGAVSLWTLPPETLCATSHEARRRQVEEKENVLAEPENGTKPTGHADMKQEAPLTESTGEDRAVSRSGVPEKSTLSSRVPSGDSAAHTKSGAKTKTKAPPPRPSARKASVQHFLDSTLAIRQHAASSAIRSVSWSPFDPERFVAGGHDGEVRLWDVRDPSVPLVSLRTAGKKSQWVVSVAWGADEGEVVVARDNGTVCMLDLRQGSLVANYKHTAEDYGLFAVDVWRGPGCDVTVLSSAADGHVLASPGARHKRSSQTVMDLVHSASVGHDPGDNGRIPPSHGKRGLGHGHSHAILDSGATPLGTHPASSPSASPSPDMTTTPTTTPTTTTTVPDAPYADAPPSPDCVSCAPSATLRFSAAPTAWVDKGRGDTVSRLFADWSVALYCVRVSQGDLAPTLVACGGSGGVVRILALPSALKVALARPHRGRDWQSKGTGMSMSLSKGRLPREIALSRPADANPQAESTAAQQAERAEAAQPTAGGDAAGEGAPPAAAPVAPRRGRPKGSKDKKKRKPFKWRKTLEAEGLLPPSADAPKGKGRSKGKGQSNASAMSAVKSNASARATSDTKKRGRPKGSKDTKPRVKRVKV